MKLLNKLFSFKKIDFSDSTTPSYSDSSSYLNETNSSNSFTRTPEKGKQKSYHLYTKLSSVNLNKRSQLYRALDCQKKGLLITFNIGRYII